MSRNFILLLSVAFLILLPLNAAIYKGQKIYLKKCLDCHGLVQDFVSKQSMKEWEILMKNSGKILSDVHLKNKNAKNAWGYFKGTKYYKDSRHLKDFLMEYANDSGKILVSE